MNLDSAVVQISCNDDRLLVSTQSRCYVCDTVKEQYRQVGTKLREGEYGACYLGDDEKVTNEFFLSFSFNYLVICVHYIQLS